jgi:hypothetical protein
VATSIKILGVSEDLEIFEDKLVITPRGVMGFLTKGLKGSKEIPYASITAVQFKEAGLVFSGYIQFTLPGGNESKGGIFAATRDENTVMFVNTVNEEMKKAKLFIQERIGQASKINQTSNVSIADEITKLKRLKDDGAISEEEFNNMKTSLIKKSA